MIRLLVMDVDGTLTDGKIYMGNQGEIMKAFHVKDGYAIAHLLPENHIIPAIITGRVSEIVMKRTKELGVTEVYQGITDKLLVFHYLLEKYGIEMSETAYMGDDLLDLPCIKICKISGCPSDAAAQVRKEVQFVSECRGGEGALREFAEYVVKLNEEVQ